MSADCIFCKIVSGENSCYKLLETPTVLAFLDIFPSAKGHSLVIPKKHYVTLPEIPEQELRDVIAVAQKVSKAAAKAVNADGFNLLQSNNKAAGQVVMHAHFHVIPRFGGDGLPLGHKSTQVETPELEKTHKEILKSL